MRSTKSTHRCWVTGGAVAAAGLAVVLALPALPAGSASAEVTLPASIIELQDSPTGLCLAQIIQNPYYSANGLVQTLVCGGTDEFSDWNVTQNADGSVTLSKVWTGQYLESSYPTPADPDGTVFTEGPTGSTAQEWFTDENPSGGIGFCKVYTGLCLDSNSSGDVYTDPGNGDANQGWNAL
jgi:hypothetical protein